MTVKSFDRLLDKVNANPKRVELWLGKESAKTTSTCSRTRLTGLDPRPADI